jgi:N-formylglutamate amidohydrolase
VRGRLPLLLSLPHAGLGVPPEVAAINRLGEEDIRRDGDEQAAAIYRPLRERVAAFVDTEVARAFVDANRAEDDIRRDGVVKTHTCWDVPIYTEPLGGERTRLLLERYHRPYHRGLVREAGGVGLGLDCHTMAAAGPPVGPDPGRPRPRLCLGDLEGASCDGRWTAALARCLAEAFGEEVRVNDPFRGGWITRSRPGGIPWLQLEISREPWIPAAAKSAALARALAAFAPFLAGEGKGRA